MIRSRNRETWYEGEIKCVKPSEGPKKLRIAFRTAALQVGECPFLLVNGVAGLEDSAAIGNRVLVAFRDPFDLDGHELFQSASVGVALYRDDGEDAETLLKNADTAMYGAKLARRNNQLHNAPAMNAQATAATRARGRPPRGSKERRVRCPLPAPGAADHP